jgi:exosortase
MSAPMSAPAPPASRRVSRSVVAAAVLLIAALGWAYAPTFRFLTWIWSIEPNYTYGYLVIPIVLWVLWERRDRLDRARLAPKAWGWAALIGVLAVRAVLYEWNERWLEDATLLLTLSALALALGGWALWLWAWPALILLAFMFPLPQRFNLLLAAPLQRCATWASCALLQAVGLPVIADGNVLNIGTEELEVERACSGLSMLLTFLFLMTATAILVRRSWWERLVLLASAIPFALAANVLRIGITAFCYYQAGTDELRLFDGRLTLPHDWAGYLMMPIGLALACLELWLMAWLFVEEEPGSAQDPLIALAPSAARPVGKSVRRGGS